MPRHKRKFTARAIGLKIGPSFRRQLLVFGLALFVMMGPIVIFAIYDYQRHYSQLTEEEQASTGVTPGLIRLSVGVEDIRDIIADIDQALKAATQKSAASA